MSRCLYRRVVEVPVEVDLCDYLDEIDTQDLLLELQRRGDANCVDMSVSTELDATIVRLARWRERHNPADRDLLDILIELRRYSSHQRLPSSRKLPETAPGPLLFDKRGRAMPL